MSGTIRRSAGAGGQTSQAGQGNEGAGQGQRRRLVTEPRIGDARLVARGRGHAQTVRFSSPGPGRVRCGVARNPFGSSGRLCVYWSLSAQFRSSPTCLGGDALRQPRSEQPATPPDFRAADFLRTRRRAIVARAAGRRPMAKPPTSAIRPLTVNREREGKTETSRRWSVFPSADNLTDRSEKLLRGVCVSRQLQRSDARVHAEGATTGPNGHNGEGGPPRKVAQSG
jgi:hypothetical protein